jgi:hypothetical protein
MSVLHGIILSFHSEGSSVHTCAIYLAWLVSPSPCPVSGTLETFTGIIIQNPCIVFNFFLVSSFVLVDILSSVWDRKGCLYVLLCEFIANVI